MISESQLSIFQCPTCTSDLSQEGTYLVCVNCGSRFPIIDNIIIFLTKDDLAGFLGETWGNELLKENTGFYPGFFYASNEDDLESLQQVLDEARGEVKIARSSSDDPGIPDEVNRAIEKSRDETVRLSRARSAKRILDWPTGPGYCLEYLIDQIDPEALFVALDVDFRRLTRTKARLEKKGLSSNLIFAVADARKMPFKDGVFQAVTAWGGTLETGNPELCLRETCRVLEENGWFGINGEQYKEGSPSAKLAEQLGLASLETRAKLESAMQFASFRNLEYEVLYEGYGFDDDLPDEERCPLPARGDWYQLIAASGQK